LSSSSASSRVNCDLCCDSRVCLGEVEVILVRADVFSSSCDSLCSTALESCFAEAFVDDASIVIAVAGCDFAIESSLMIVFVVVVVVVVGLLVDRIEAVADLGDELPEPIELLDVTTSFDAFSEASRALA
jgi:hypothetical protein